MCPDTMFRQGRPFPDPLVKVYDTRTMRPLPPVPFSAGPAFIDILPKRASTIVVTSPQGLVNIVDVTNVANTEFQQVSARIPHSFGVGAQVSVARCTIVRYIECGLSYRDLPRVWRRRRSYTPVDCRRRGKHTSTEWLRRTASRMGRSSGAASRHRMDGFNVRCYYLLNIVVTHTNVMQASEHDRDAVL